MFLSLLEKQLPHSTTGQSIAFKSSLEGAPYQGRYKGGSFLREELWAPVSPHLLFQFLGDRQSRGPYLANITLLLVGASMISLVHVPSSQTLLCYSIPCLKFQTSLKSLAELFTNPTQIFFNKLPLISWLAALFCAKSEKHSGKVYSQAKQSKQCLFSFKKVCFFFRTATISS